MKRSFFSALVLLVTLIASATYAGNLSKARDSINKGLYPQAIELLDKEIKENPTNSEAHFELGSCYLHEGRYSEANERFTNAVRLKSDYGYKIGDIYKTAALWAADKGQTNKTITLLSEAITYQPDLKSGLVIDMMSKGKSYIQQGNYNNADVRFLVATALDPSLKKEVCDIYGQLGDSASDEKSISFYNRASQYCNAYNDAEGRKYLELAKKMARTPGKDEERYNYREKAAQYLGNSIVAQEVPDFKEFGEGQYMIGNFKKDEQTPFWLGTEIRLFSIKFRTTGANENFTIITPNGEKFDWWIQKDRTAFLKKRWDNTRFKVLFHEDMNFGWRLTKKNDFPWPTMSRISPHDRSF